MTVWYQPRNPDRRAAHHDSEAGEIILDFGKHEGSSIRDVPTEYLQWLTQGSGFVPDEVREIAGVILRQRVDADTQTWWATNAHGRQVAHRDRETGAVIVDFGAFKGKPLQQVADGYLGWMVNGDGCETLPADLRDLAAGELERREQAPPPEDEYHEITIDGRDFIEWGREATAGDMQEVAGELRTFADVLDSRLDSMAEEVLDRLDVDIDQGGLRED